MKKGILIILSFVVLIIIPTYFYFFSPDTIFPLFQEEPFFYLHLNLSDFSYFGQKGMKWVKNYWPSFKITESPLINFNPVYLSLMDEAVLAFYDNQQLEPILVYKLKPQFQKFDWSFIGPNLRLNKKYIVLAKNDKLFEKLKPAKSLLPKNFFNQFLSGFLKILNSKINFLGQPKKNYLLFQGDCSYQFSLAGENKILTKVEKFIGGNPEVAFWNFSPIGGLEGKFIFPKDFFKNPNFFLLEDKNYLLVAPQEENLEDLLLKYLSEKFPQEIERTLPDGSKIFELVSDPSLFKRQIKEYSGWQIKSLKEKDFNLGLAEKGSLIILSNNPDWLEEKINLFENPDLESISNFYFLKNKCLKNFYSEMIYWQNRSFRAISGVRGREIEGCSDFVQKFEP